MYIFNKHVIIKIAMCDLVIFVELTVKSRYWEENRLSSVNVGSDRITSC